MAIQKNAIGAFNLKNYKYLRVIWFYENWCDLSVVNKAKIFCLLLLKGIGYYVAGVSQLQRQPYYVAGDKFLVPYDSILIVVKTKHRFQKCNHFSTCNCAWLIMVFQYVSKSTHRPFILSINLLSSQLHSYISATCIQQTQQQPFSFHVCSSS